MQTLKVEQVPCGTSGGVLVAFSSVEVVFRLGPADVWGTVKNYSTSFAETWVRDPIHHEVRSCFATIEHDLSHVVLCCTQVNQVCSQHSLNEVVISKFSELSGIVKKRLEVLLDGPQPFLFFFLLLHSVKQSAPKNAFVLNFPDISSIYFVPGPPRSALPWNTGTNQTIKTSHLQQL